MIIQRGSHWLLGTAVALATVYFASIAAFETAPAWGEDDDTFPAEPDDDGVMYLPLTW